MKDKVAELRKILDRKRASELKTQPFDDGAVVGDRDEGSGDRDQVAGVRGVETGGSDQGSGFRGPGSGDRDEGIENSDALFGGVDPQEFEKLRQHCEELKKANDLQKDMYLRQVAESDNFKKRLQREHDEFVKFALEKFLNEILPVIDGLESTLDHASQDDPIYSGVSLTLKQFLQVLEKFGVQQIAGHGEPFNPHTQEAIGTQKDESLGSGNVVTVHRKGYVLNGKVIRAALVTVGE